MPQCTGDADCVAPGACQLAQGARCLDGACVYPAAAPPAAPTLTAPADDATLSVYPPSMSWQQTEGVGYTVRLADDAAIVLDAPQYQVQDASSPHAVVIALDVGTYHWAVVAVNEQGCETASEVRAFTLDDSCAIRTAPVVVGPPWAAGGPPLLLGDPLEWEAVAGAVAYEVTTSRAADMQAGTTTRTTTTTLGPDGHPIDATGDWWFAVRACTDTCCGPWSPSGGALTSGHPLQVKTYAQAPAGCYDVDVPTTEGSLAQYAPGGVWYDEAGDRLYIGSGLYACSSSSFLGCGTGVVQSEVVRVDPLTMTEEAVVVGAGDGLYDSIVGVSGDSMRGHLYVVTNELVTVLGGGARRVLQCDLTGGGCTAIDSLDGASGNIFKGVHYDAELDLVLITQEGPSVLRAWSPAQGAMAWTAPLAGTANLVGARGGDAPLIMVGEAASVVVFDASGAAAPPELFRVPASDAAAVTRGFGPGGDRYVAVNEYTAGRTRLFRAGTTLQRFVALPITIEGLDKAGSIAVDPASGDLYVSEWGANGSPFGGVPSGNHRVCRFPLVD